MYFGTPTFWQRGLWDSCFQNPNESSGDSKEVTLFSDSQSAVGILTFRWQNNLHKQVVAEINQTFKSIEKEQIQINLKWTPGHADIAGNEIADQVEKTAAEEAERMPEVTNLVTVLEKTAVQESCNIKWQKRWEAGATGRQLFDLLPSVNVQTVPVQSIKTQRIISELRTGYCRLVCKIHIIVDVGIGRVFSTS